MPALTAAWRAVICPCPARMHLAHEDVVDLVGQTRRPAAAPRRWRSRRGPWRVNPANAPDSFPMGVRAPATMTASAIPSPPVHAGLVTGRKPHRTGQLSSGHMSDILSAVWPAPPADELAGLPMPDSYRAAVVKRSEIDMFEGMESADKDPRRSLHVEEVPLPELAPDEAYVAVMASSINFNTVWTSIFEPLPTFGFLDRLGQGRSLGGAPRARLPRGRLGRRRRRPADGLGGAQLEGGRQGHRPLQLRRRPGPLGPRRLHAGGQPAHLGLRVELRRPGRHHRGQGEPAHAQAGAPELGGGGRQRACATRPPTACWSPPTGRA